MERGEDDLGEPTLSFWVTADEEADGGDAMGIFGNDRDRAVLRSIPVGPLRKNLAETVDSLQQIFADIAARPGTLSLTEAQLTFQVTATGGVQLIGTGQMQSGRGLTLTFKRQ
ncbi:Pepco domain-containing protein [Streptomyces atratus]